MRATLNRALLAYVGFALVVACATFWPQPATAASPAESDSFTAVAGTESVVTDRREQNNTALASAFILTLCILLAAGALRHAKSKNDK